jgi:hypothetical protein
MTSREFVITYRYSYSHHLNRMAMMNEPARPDDATEPTTHDMAEATSHDMNEAARSDDMAEATTMDPEVPVDNGADPSVEETPASNTNVASSPEAPTRNNKKKLIFILLAVFLLVAVVVIVPVVVVNQKNKDGETTTAAAVSPPTYEELVWFLVKQQISSERFLADPESPQALAARWMTERDGARLRLPGPDLSLYESYMYMFRYVMAVNYYALDGPQWEQQHGFLTDVDVCEWNERVVVSTEVSLLGVRCQVVGIGDNQVHVPYLLYLSTYRPMVACFSYLAGVSSRMCVYLVRMVQLFNPRAKFRQKTAS